MKRRTYEYYIIARNLGKDDEELVHRADKLSSAEELFFNTEVNPGDAKFLCRLNVIEKVEVEK